MLRQSMLGKERVRLTHGAGDRNGVQAGNTDFLLGRGPCTVVAEETLATVNLETGVSGLA